MILVFLLILVTAAPTAAAERVLIPQGVYEPIYRDRGETDQVVGPFWIDKTPVTHAEFFAFVKENPQWAPGKPPSIFVDANYLSGWSQGQPPAGQGSHPVTQVSWFAAKAYCESKGARLATIAEWEHAMDIQNPEYKEEILKWYSRPSTHKVGAVGQRKPNVHGVQDGWGLVWEWVENFSTVIMSGDSRSSVAEDMFCGGAALGAKDPELYAVFLRFAFWSSLKASYGGKSLGFRCVKDGGSS